jgi:hypothetical protein
MVGMFYVLMREQRAQFCFVDLFSSMTLALSPRVYVSGKDFDSCDLTAPQKILFTAHVLQDALENEVRAKGGILKTAGAKMADAYQQRAAILDTCAKLVLQE